jgi:hypothetical protein
MRLSRKSPATRRMPRCLVHIEAQPRILQDMTPSETMKWLRATLVRMLADDSVLGQLSTGTQLGPFAYSAANAAVSMSQTK